MNIETKTLNIYGMTCSSCIRNVEQAVSGQEGVDVASVNYATEKLQVTYDTEKISIEDLIYAVKKKGYDASLPNKELTKSFIVKGMTCASCVKRVEDHFLLTMFDSAPVVFTYNNKISIIFPGEELNPGNLFFMAHCVVYQVEENL